MSDLYPRAYWRFVLCDLKGNPISLLSTIAQQKRAEYPLNRPSSFTFNVPSDNQLVNTEYTDDGFGEPYLTVGCRTVKAYRKIVPNDDEDWGIVGNWLVWSLEDSGDGNSCRTAVTCFDPLQRLVKRMCRRADGNFAKTVRFNGQTGDYIARTLLDRTLTYAGSCGITQGTYDSTSIIPIVEYEQAKVGPSIQTLTDTGTMDIWMEPLNVVDDDDSQANFNIYEQLGEEKDATIFGYAAPPRNSGTYRRALSMDDVANDLTMWPGSTKRKKAHATDGTSQDKYTVYEDAEVLSDINTTELAEDLVTEQLALRKNPRDLVAVTPLAGVAPVWNRDYATGDTVPVHIGFGNSAIGGDAGSPTREALTGLQRIYNVVIEPGDAGVEVISAVECEPQT